MSTTALQLTDNVFQMPKRGLNGHANGPLYAEVLENKLNLNLFLFCKLQRCAPGYYRARTGPYLGVCVPCQCNGRADTCDPQTGECIVSVFTS